MESLLHQLESNPKKRKIHPARRLFLSFFASLGLFLVLGQSPGNAFLSAAEQALSFKAPILIKEGQTLGQTFLSWHRGLKGISVLLRPLEKGSGQIGFHLRENSQSKNDLIYLNLPVSRIKEAGYTLFSFDPLKDSASHDYYFFLTIQGTGTLEAATGPGDSYLQGALYQNGVAQDRQLNFHLQHQTGQRLLGLGLEGGRWLGLLLLSAWLFIVPGWALLPLLGPSFGQLSWAAKIGLAAGLTLAVYPLLFLWTDLIGFHWGPYYAWIPSLLGITALVWRNRSRRPGDLKRGWSSWVQSEKCWPDLALVSLLGLIFLTRFYVIRVIEVPMWGDSYHHTLISQLLVDHQGLFNNWEPYADLRTFTYHFGFHTAVALFHWTTGFDLPKACLWTGQVLNSLSILALIPLALKVGVNRWAGVGALLVAGLLSPMPMFYINWGRYTQLAGQVILPAVVFVVWTIMESRQPKWPVYLLASLALAGLGLTHYRVLIFAVLFILALILMANSWDNLRRLAFRIVLITLGSSILFLPWLWHIFSGSIFDIFSSQLTTPPHQLTEWAKQYNAIGDLITYLPLYLWLLLPFMIGWGLWLRQKNLAIISLWWLLVVLAANPGWIKLPGAGILSNFAVFIAFYLPAGVIGGASLSWLVDRFNRFPSQKLIPGFIFLLILGVGFWGATLRVKNADLANNQTVTRPDLRAIAWLKQQTSPRAAFLVNAFFAFDDSIINGMDAGWWLPLLAGRQTMLPPLLYGTEKGSRPDNRQWINALVEQIQKKGLENGDVLNLLSERGITHLYIGQRVGQVSLGSFRMDPQQLILGRHFIPIYHQDRVWVFELKAG